MNHDPKKPVSLEDLLHLKRSERPPEQFWVQFESELRAKQLAAIVQHRPWWNSWERISRLLARQSLPIGATAVLALGLVSFREYRARSAHAEVSIPLAPKVSTAGLGNDADEGATASGEAIAVTVPAKAVVPVAAPVRIQVAPVQAQETKPALAVDSGKDPFSALVGGTQRSVQPAPLQSDAWSHFGDQQLAANALASPAGFAPRSFANTVAEPLAQMANPLDERRAMLLSGSLPRDDNAAPESDSDGFTAAPQDRTASRISDDRLYEQIRRYGVGGNRFSVRF